MVRAAPSATSRARKLPIASTRARWASGTSWAMRESELRRKTKKSAGGMIELRLHAPLEGDTLVADPACHLRSSLNLAKRRESGPAVVGNHDLGEVVERHAQRHLVAIPVGRHDDLSRYVRCFAGYEQRGDPRKPQDPIAPQHALMRDGQIASIELARGKLAAPQDQRLRQGCAA